MSRRHLFVCVLVALFVLLFWIGTPFLVPRWNQLVLPSTVGKSGDPGQSAVENRVDPGQFGDMFGTANALFSGLAFLGVLVALFLQNRELVETRDQISKQVSLMRASALLAALPPLLEREITHVKTVHEGELIRFDIATAHPDAFPQKITELRKEVEANEKLPGGKRESSRRCLIANLERVHRYHKALDRLFNELDSSEPA